jgi:hypothetical protein
MENYLKIKKCFEERGCTLCTTFEEFEEKRKNVRIQYYQFVRVDFIGTCSHKSSVVYTNFFLRNTGMTCKDCILQQMKNRPKMNLNEIEYEGIKIIETYLQYHYTIMRTKEGCTADLAIRCHTDEKDEWIPIQVKATTNVSHGMYSFRKVKDTYKNMLLLCVCIQEQKVWLIPYNNLTIKSNLNISRVSKYNQYMVDLSSIHDRIESYRNQIHCTTLDILCTPLTDTQQKEQRYSTKRERMFPFLTYEYPIIQNSAVDVIINGKKVQEKVLGFNHKKSTLVGYIGCNNGSKDKKRKFRSYFLGENDYYWLHSSIDERFWIIPENVLYEKGLITANDSVQNIKHLYINSKNNTWLSDYQYDYTAIEQEKMIAIFR